MATDSEDVTASFLPSRTLRGHYTRDIATNLCEGRVETAGDPTALSWLILEGDLDAMYGKGWRGGVCTAVVLCVQLFEGLHQHQVTVSLHLSNNIRLRSLYTCQTTSGYGLSPPVKQHQVTVSIYLSNNVRLRSLSICQTTSGYGLSTPVKQHQVTVSLHLSNNIRLRSLSTCQTTSGYGLYIPVKQRQVTVSLHLSNNISLQLPVRLSQSTRDS